MSIKDRTPTLSEIIFEAIEKKLLDIHTILPGRVEKYYGDQSADIKPLITKKMRLSNNLQEVSLPIITKASVVGRSVNNGNTYVHLPLKVGDLGILLICERSLDNYLASTPDINDKINPSFHNNARHHDLSDAWFIPGGLPFSKALQDVSEDDIVIKNNDIKINIKPDGKITINNESYELIETLSSLLDNLINATVQTDDGPRPFTSTTISDLNSIKTKIDSFKG